MQDLRNEKEDLVLEILNKYHYFRWGEETRKSIYLIPNDIQILYFRLGVLEVFPASSQEETKKQIAELKVIRKKLKKFYGKGERNLWNI